MSPEESNPTDFIREAVTEDLKNGRYKAIRTRLAKGEIKSTVD